MRLKIHFKENGKQAEVILGGTDLVEIMDKWKTYAEKIGVDQSKCWSEPVKDEPWGY